MPRRSVLETPPPPAPPVGARKQPPARVPVLLLDTNIVLDVVLARTPWDAEAVALLEAIARDRAVGHIAGHAVTTIHYIVEHGRGRSAAVTAIGDLLQVVGVVPLDTADFQRALALGLKDFEDAAQVATALRVGADFLVTRNPRDFKRAPVRTRTAGEVYALLARTTSE